MTLLFKLRQNFGTGKILNGLTEIELLKARSQRVALNRKCLQQISLKSGGLQGYIFGPTALVLVL